MNLPQKVIMFGGKGGVGKTTTSASTALHFSSLGEKTLIISTDPVLSLSDMFEKKIRDKETLIAENLYAVELSSDEVLRRWKEKFGDRLKILTNSENLGFGPAHNQGTQVSDGNIVVEISNDMIFQGDYISPIEEAIKNDPNAFYGPQLVDFDTGWNTFDGETIIYLYGWCLFCTRQVWDDIGGFDERFVPCDYEDIDICMRAVENGHPLKQVKLPIIHMSGQSALNLEGGRGKYTVINQQRFKEKWGLT